MLKNLVGNFMLTLLYTINLLNNAILASKQQIRITKFNNLTLNVLIKLQQLNYIESFLVNKAQTSCLIFLVTNRTSLYFQQIHSISTPHKFIYITYSELIKLRLVDSTTDYLLSTGTTHTIMTSDEAIRCHSGGLLLLKLNV